MNEIKFEQHINDFLPSIPVSIIGIAKLWQVREMIVREWIRDGLLKASKDAGRYVITRDQALEFLAKYGLPKNTVHEGIRWDK